MLTRSALAEPPKAGPKYQTDRGTVGFLHYNLLSGANVEYPREAWRAKLQGSGFFFMRLRPDGHVDSVTVKMSTGYAELDGYVVRTLNTYQFRPNTKGPLLWLVGFLQPATVIVQLHRIKEPTAPMTRRK